MHAHEPQQREQRQEARGSQLSRTVIIFCSKAPRSLTARLQHIGPRYVLSLAVSQIVSAVTFHH